MLKKFPEGSLLPFKKFFSAQKRVALWKKLSRAFKAGLASLVLGGCASAIPGLHVSAGYDGEAIPPKQPVATTAFAPNGKVPSELIADLAQK